MFAYIRGNLEEIETEYTVIDVNGIGYKIYTASSTLQSLPKVSEVVKLHTHLHVREDAFIIYGFLTKEELRMFELLITVSGIGPKGALGVLSSISPSQFSLMVISNDVKGLTRAPGIGAKTAQRLILDLKDKLTAVDACMSEAEESIKPQEADASEAVNALIVLGYTPADAASAVRVVADESMEVEEIIKKALRVLAK